ANLLHDQRSVEPNLPRHLQRDGPLRRPDHPRTPRPGPGGPDRFGPHRGRPEVRGGLHLPARLGSGHLGRFGGVRRRFGGDRRVVDDDRVGGGRADGADPELAGRIAEGLAGAGAGGVGFARHFAVGRLGELQRRSWLRCRTRAGFVDNNKKKKKKFVTIYAYEF
ncbi:unnamed protein product, partial [Linum tenue]